MIAALESLIGLPWLLHGRDRQGLDCWGLVWLAYREIFGIELPTGLGAYRSAADRLENSRLIMGGIGDWREIERQAAQAGDVLLMARGRFPCHVALVTKWPWLLHARENTGTVQQPLSRIEREGFGFVGIYRHRERR